MLRDGVSLVELQLTDCLGTGDAFVGDGGECDGDDGFELGVNVFDEVYFESDK